MKRRNFLLLSSVAASSLITGAMGSIFSENKSIFNNQLAIPSLLEGERINDVYCPVSPRYGCLVS